MSQEVFTATPWPIWRKLLFRFFFIYLMIQLAPWLWFAQVGGLYDLTGYYNLANDWLIESANRHIFHVRDVLVPFNGSGDTSYGWTQLWAYLSLAALGSLVWSMVDTRRPGYDRADYWLRTAVRYYLAIHCFGYGIAKIYAMQMPFPNLSQLATPLGDFLPMRLSWLFMGYSTPYQTFAGVMETVAGILLLNRRTVTVGLLVAAGVFTNVVMMNLSYDIPVKIFSMQLLFYCIFLLAYDWKRLANFFLNKPAEVTNMYEPPFAGRWIRVSRLALKVIFIGLMAAYPLFTYYQYYSSLRNLSEIKPIKPGIYDVRTFVLNGDTIPALMTDTVRWRDVVFEKGGGGSVGSTDTTFRQLYRRGYFVYKSDTTAKTLSLSRRSWSRPEMHLFDLHYDIPGDNEIRLWGKIREDSLYVELKKSKRHFQLAERQFHWLSEYNR